MLKTSHNMNLEIPQNEILYEHKSTEKFSPMINLLKDHNVMVFKQVKHQKNVTHANEPFIRPNIKNVYLIDGQKTKILNLETIKKYILTICQKMKVEHLDIDKIANNVYPKLKSKNTIKDV